VNLKVFHLAFIVISTVLALWLGFWCLSGYRQQADMGSMLGMLGSFAAATGLAVYGVAFWRKAKRL
jgi:hypothetical protein